MDNTPSEVLNLAEVVRLKNGSQKKKREKKESLFLLCLLGGGSFQVYKVTCSGTDRKEVNWDLTE